MTVREWWDFLEKDKSKCMRYAIEMIGGIKARECFYKPYNEAIEQYDGWIDCEVVEIYPYNYTNSVSTFCLAKIKG